LKRKKGEVEREHGDKREINRVEKRLRKVVAERKNCHNTLKGGS
jgi:hypothetical protein